MATGLEKGCSTEETRWLWMAFSMKDASSFGSTDSGMARRRLTLPAQEVSVTYLYLTSRILLMSVDLAMGVCVSCSSGSFVPSYMASAAFCWIP